MGGATENGSGLIIRRELLAVLVTLGLQIGGLLWWAAAMNQRMAAVESAVREQGATMNAQFAGMNAQLAKLQDAVYEVRAAQRVTDSSMGDVRRRLDTVESRK